jgi:hypothetical protein
MRRALVLAGLALAGCGAQPRLSAAPAPSGRLHLAGREPGSLTRVDVAAGTATAHQVPQLTGGDPPYFLTFTGGRLVVFGLGEATSSRPISATPGDRSRTRSRRRSCRTAACSWCRPGDAS